MRGDDEDWARFEEEEKANLRREITYDAYFSGDVLPLTIALVGCGSAKKKHAAPARELYTGSLFRLAYAHAERTADDVLILSALHGIVEPHTEIEPYDLTFSKMFRHERDDWGKGVVSDLFTHYPLTPLTLVFYAGQQYIRPVLRWSAHQMGYWTWQNPLEGLDLFHRIRWFTEREHMTS